MNVVQMRNAKLEALRRRESELKKRIAQEEQKGKKQERKDDTHEKVLIGAAFLADMKIHPETRAAVEVVLKRAIITERNREFLKSRGWL
jgi:hypothetical protein